MQYVADDRDMFVPSHDADGRKLTLAVHEDLRKALLATDLQDRTAIHAFLAEGLRTHARAPLPGTRKSISTEGRSASRDEQMELCMDDAHRLGFKSVKQYIEPEGQKREHYSNGPG